MSKEFEELLSHAPAAEEPTVSLTGFLSKSSQPKHFVLDLSNGSAVTLPVTAVRSHKVIAGSAGRALVSVELDRKSVSADVLQYSWVAPDGQTTGPDEPVKIGSFDKHPIQDKHPANDGHNSGTGARPDAQGTQSEGADPNLLPKPLRDPKPLYDGKVPWYDMKHPILEFKLPNFDHKIPWIDQKAPYMESLQPRSQSPASGVPFGLATAHQSPHAAAIAEKS